MEPRPSWTPPEGAAWPLSTDRSALHQERRPLSCLLRKGACRRDAARHRIASGGEHHDIALSRAASPTGKGFDHQMRGCRRSRGEARQGRVGQAAKGFGRGERMKIGATFGDMGRVGMASRRALLWGLRSKIPNGSCEVLDPQRVEKEAESKNNAAPWPCGPPGVKWPQDEERPREGERGATVAAVAGTLGRLLLESLGIEVRGAVTSIGGVYVAPPQSELEWAFARSSSMGSPRQEDEELLEKVVRSAMEKGDSVGGTFVVSAVGLPPGIGSYAEWDRRLDGRLAAALMAIPAIMGVEIGDGFPSAGRLGSEVHDEILLRDGELARATNRAGGLEGGMTNGEEVIVRAAMKPIPTIKNPLRTVDIETGIATTAHAERSDTCAVPACVGRRWSPDLGGGGP